VSSSVDLSEVICMWDKLKDNDSIDYDAFEKAVGEIVYISDDVTFPDTFGVQATH